MFREELPDIRLSKAVPQSAEKIKHIRELIRDYAAEKNLVPPLQEEEVIHHSGILIWKHPELFPYRKLLAVMINNYAWHRIFSGIPFNRRILLLPKCMSHSTECPAEYDDLGLLCQQCGRCDIAGIITRADELGYHTIVSEGTTAVTLLLASGKVECVIGVGCLHSFERSFPLAVKEAVPSIAIPLFNAECKDSRVDLDWLNEVLSLRDETNWQGWIDLNLLKQEIGNWFTLENLHRLLESEDATSNIACKWMASGGKRWRPLIMVAVCKALGSMTDANTEAIMKLAVAVECFHKASLVHDDIEDDDAERYGAPALHEQHDIPVAINIGDLLMGYGYQLIARAWMKGEQITQLLTIAAQGHRDLSLGQGEELLWRRRKELLPVQQILKIFSNKTSPAFEVALLFGAVVAGGDKALMEIIRNYSRALGIAYQIKDDLEDFNADIGSNSFNILQPSLITAIINERDPLLMQDCLERTRKGDETVAAELSQLTQTKEAVQEAEKLLEDYKQKALNTLKELNNPAMKILLIRLLNKII
ncbi:DUF116 domain-containing protein [Marinilabiliaceae bacterium JC017]|nr:DUF116 domain-containing protein [Marinilabiliaceae bacterium JC017]